MDVGTAGVIVYEPVILHAIDDRLVLEAHPDVDRQARDPLAFIADTVAAGGLGGRIGWRSYGWCSTSVTGVRISWMCRVRVLSRSE